MSQDQPLLGLATTRELLDEIRVRGETEPYYRQEGDEMAIGAANLLGSLPGSMLDYSTVKGRREEMLEQEAPYPSSLRSLVEMVRYKRDWRFSLRDMNRGQGSKGLTLVIAITGPDSYHPENSIKVNHYMPVPPAAYDERNWQRWLFEQILLVERHDAMKFFRFPPGEVGGKEERPYAPNHGPGNDPYTIPDYREDIDRRTSFTGEVNDH